MCIRDRYCIEKLTIIGRVITEIILTIAVKEIDKAVSKLYEFKEEDSFKSLALKSSININAEDQLRLINGDYPHKTLKAGRLIKLVQ